MTLSGVYMNTVDVGRERSGWTRTIAANSWLLKRGMQIYCDRVEDPESRPISSGWIA